MKNLAENKVTPRENIFEKIASAFKKIDIAVPIKVMIRPSGLYSMVDELYEKLSTDLDNSPCIVEEKGKIYGCIYWAYWQDEFDRYSDKEHAQKFSVPITQDMCISASLSLLDIFSKLDIEEIFFFVQFGKEITHFLQYSHFDKLPVHICLFLLILQLETIMNELLLNTRNLK